jgi:transposase-like protein
MDAETRAVAEREIGRFAREYGAKYPKAVASLTVDQDRLLAYFDYPAEHSSICARRIRSTPRSQQPGCAKA